MQNNRKELQKLNVKHTIIIGAIVTGILLLFVTIFFIFSGIFLIHATEEPLPTAQVEATDCVSIYDVTLSKEEMDEMLIYMDAVLVTAITEDLGTATPQEYVIEYTRCDPEFHHTLVEEFGIYIPDFEP